MSIVVDFHIHRNHLIAKCAGEWINEDIYDAFVKIKSELKSLDINMLIVDAMNIQPPHVDRKRYDVGVKFGEVFGHSYKIAVLYPEKYTTKYVEDVAINRGANVVVLSCMQDAENWLYGA